MNNLQAVIAVFSLLTIVILIDIAHHAKTSEFEKRNKEDSKPFEYIIQRLLSKISITSYLRLRHTICKIMLFHWSIYASTRKKKLPRVKRDSAGVLLPEPLWAKLASKSAQESTFSQVLGEIESQFRPERGNELKSWAKF